MKNNARGIMRRLLAGLLTLCMLLPIMPQPASPLWAGAEDAESLIYDFRKCYPNASIKGITYDMTTVGGSAEMNVGIHSDPWAASAQMIDGLSNYQQAYLTNAANMGIRIGSTFDDGPVFKFKVPVKGKYMPAVTVAGSWDGGFTVAGASLKFIIGKAQSNGKIAVGDRIVETGGVNAAGLNGPMTIYLTDEPIELEAGEYGLQIAGDPAAKAVYPGANGCVSYIRDLQLLVEGDYNKKIAVTPGAKAKTVEYDFSVLNNASTRGSQVAASAITYADTQAAGTGAWSIYGYLPKNQMAEATVWTPETLGMYYKYEGKGLTHVADTSNPYTGGGIMFHVPADGKYVVTLNAGNTNSAHAVDFYIMPLKANRSIGTATTTAAEDRAMTVKVKAEQDYAFNGGEAIELKAGEYLLGFWNPKSSFEVSINKLTITSNEAADLIYDFRKCYPNASIKGITYDMTTVGGSAEMNVGIHSDPWAASAQMIDGLSNYQQAYLTNAANMGIRIGSTFDAGPVFKFKVPVKGKYMPAVTVAGSWDGGFTVAGASLKFIIGKMQANGSIAVGDRIVETGGVNAAGLNGPMTIYLTDEPIELEAGEYGLQIAGDPAAKAIYPGANGCVSYIRDLQLLTEGSYSEKIEIKANAAPEDLVYDFSALNNSDTRGSQVAASAITYADTQAAGTGAWSIYGYLPKNQMAEATIWTPETLGMYYKYEGKGLTHVADTSNPYTGGGIMFHVPADGEYVVTLNAGNTNSAHAVDFYIMPLKANRSIGTATTTAAEDRAMTVKVKAEQDYAFNGGEAIELKAGEYLLGFWNTKSSFEVSINKLTMKSVGVTGGGTASNHPIYDFRKAYPTATTAITYDMTTVGNAAELNKDIHSDPWAATAQFIASGDYSQAYLANAINMGIRINSTFDAGPVIKFKVEEDGMYMPRVTVAGSWDGANTIAGANLSFAIGTVGSNGALASTLVSTNAVNAGGLNAPMYIYLSDKPISLQAGEYGLKIGGTTKGSKDTYPGEKVYYSYVSALELMKDGYPEKLEITEGEPKELTYNFKALNSSEKLGSQAAASAISYQDTIAAGSAPWTIYSFKAGNYLADATPWAADREGFYYKYADKGLTVANNTEDRVQYSGAVMIHVPTTGYYSAKFVAGNTNPAHSSFFYFLPLKANRAIGTANTTAVQDRANTVTVKAHGEYSFNSGAPMKLEAGEYLVFLNHEKSTFESYIDSLTLTPVDSLVIGEAGVAVKNGESATSNVGAVKMDGSAVSMAGGTVSSITVADTSIATATAAISGEKIAITVTGGKENGYTTARIEAVTADGNPVVDTVGIHVNKSATVGGENVIWDFRKGDPKAALDINYIPSLTYEMTGSGGAAEINPELYSEPWMPHNIVANSGRYTAYLGLNFQNMGFRMYKADYGPTMKLKLDRAVTAVPVLTISSTWSHTISGLNTKVVLSKLEGGKEVEIASVSGINTAAIEGPLKVQLTEEAMEFAPGEYTVKILGSDKHPDAKDFDYTFTAQGAINVQLRKFELVTNYQPKLAASGEAADTVYDFTKLNTAERRDSQSAAYAIGYQDTTAAGSAPWAIYSALWNDASNKYWAGKDSIFRSDYIPAFLYKTEGKGLTVPNVGGSGGVMFSVTAGGYYSVVADAELYNSTSGEAQLYLFKLGKNREVTERLAWTAIKVGDTQVKFNSGSPMKLDAGEYMLFAFNRGGGANGITLNKLALDAAQTNYSLDTAELAVKPRATASGTITVLGKDGSAVNFAGGVVTATVKDTAVADMTIEAKDGKLSYTLTGKTTGETTVDIVAIDGTNTAAAATVKIYVNTNGRVGGESIFYDFRKVNVGDDSKLTTWLSTITYDHTTAGSASELNPQLPSAPWRSHSLKYNNAWDYCYVLNNYQSAGIRIYTGSWQPAIDFKVTEAGTYMPIVHAFGTWAYTMGGLNASFKLSKVNADGSVTDIAQVDRVNGSGIEGTMRVEITDAPIAMEEGEYRLTVIGNGVWPGDTRASVWLQKLELAPVYEAKLAKNETAAQDLFYDFKVLNTADTRGAQDVMDAITYADVVAAGSAPWKVYTSLLRNPFGNAQFFKDHETAFLYTTEGAGITLTERSGGVMLHVPADGEYIVSFEAQAVAANASGVQVSFHPLTAKRTVEDKLEAVVINQTTADGAKTYTLNGGIPYSLKAGEYLLFAYSAGGTDLTLNNVKMVSCNIANKVDETDMTAAPRETVQGEITVLDAQGDPVSLTGGEAWLTSSDTSVAEFTGEIKDGKIAYTMTTKSAGEATIDVFVLDDNNVGARGTIKLYVNRNKRIGAEIPIFDFRKVNVGADPSDLNYMNTITYKHTTVGGANEVNPGMYSEPWAAVDLYSQDAWNYVAVLNNYQNMGIRYFNLKSPRSFKITAPESGSYIPTIVVAGTWTTLGGMNAQFEFGYNAPTGYQRLGLVKGINACAVDGYYDVELTDGPVDIVEGGEYMITVTSNGYWNMDEVPYHSIWLKSLELREPREVLATNEAAAKDLVYDFTALNDDAHRGYQDAVDAISFSDTVAAGSAPWEMYSTTPENYVSKFNFFKAYMPTMYYNAADRGLALVGHSGAVRIHVPADGWYTPHFNLYASAANDIDVYFMKLIDSASPVDEIAAMSFAPTTSAKDYAINENMPINLKAGEYILFVRAASGNDVYLNSFTLDHNNAVLSVKEEGVGVKMGGSASGEFTVYNGADENSMAGGTLDFSVEDPSIAEVSLSIKNGKIAYNVKSLKRGNTVVHISATDAQGDGLVKDIIIAVNPEGVLMGVDQSYNFTKLKGVGGTYELKDITDFAMTTAGSASEINPEIASKPWTYNSSSGQFVSYVDKDNGVMMAKDGAFISFNIRVENSGSYQVIPTTTRQGNGGLVEVYLAPEGAQDATAAEHLVGVVDTYGYGRVAGIEYPLSIIDVSKGDYTLTLKLNGKSENVTVADIRADIAKVTLAAVDAHSSISIAPGFYPSTVAKGTVIEIPLIVSETDAVDTWTPAVQVTAIPVDPSVATAEVVSSEDGTEHSLKITTLKAGYTIVNVIATKEGGDSASITMPINVTDVESVASRTYKYRFKNTAFVNDRLSVIDSYEKVTPGHPLEYRDGSGTDRWYVSDYNSKVGAQYYQDRLDKPASVIFGSNVNNFLQITIDLPESGKFQPMVPYEENTYGGLIRMWIAPKDAEDPMADEYSVGTHSGTYTAQGADNKNAYFRAVSLPAGEYKVTWKIIDNVAEVVGNASVPNYRLDGLDLIPVADFPAINVSTETLPAIEQGTMAKIKLSPVSTVAIGNNEMRATEDLFGAELAIVGGDSDLASAELVYEKDDELFIPYAAITGLKEGSGEITVAVMIDGVQRATFNVPVTVEAAAPLADAKIELNSNPTATLKLRDAGTYIADIIPTLYNTEGNIITAEGAKAMGAVWSYDSTNESVATVDENGTITPISVGLTTINYSVTINGINATANVTVRVDDGKTEATYYTAEKIAAARENVQTYKWAENTRDAAVKALAPYKNLDKAEFIWNMLTTQELPRSYYVGSPSDPDAVSNVCRYCKANLTAITGVQHCPFIRDVVNDPWKLQCPECRRKFPSNDFGAFYAVGIDEHGNWSYEQAKALGSHLLTNDLYPEMGPGWGVDDGYGYDTGEKLVLSSGKTTTIKHTWIACYNHWAHMGNSEGGFGWFMENLINAYQLTGDKTYGRLGAIITDRYADLYPDFDLGPYAYFITAGEHYVPQGKLRDYVWESGWADLGIRAYDTFYDMFDDPFVIDFLSKKAHEYDLLSPYKQLEEGQQLTSGMIRDNCELGLVREAHDAMINGEINGNFGTQHSEMALAAVVLDTFPETQEWIDWIFQTGHGAGVWHSRYVTGGNADNVIVNEVDRDGGTRETAPNYSVMWANALARVAEILGGYEEYTAKDLFHNPKYVKTIAANMPLVTGKRMTPPIGDSGSTASDTQGELYLCESTLPLAYQNTRDPFFAQALYFYNGDSAEDLRYDIFTKNPESLEDDVKNVIKEYGEYDFYSSNMLGGYGFAALRAGSKFTGLANDYYDTMQDFWIHFGYNRGHGHGDMMNLGMDAFGLDIAPDLGYPIASIGDECGNWGQNTISHNLVVVDKAKHVNENGAEALHFDDGGRVKVMDFEGADAIDNLDLDSYRRTVVMIQATDEISYGIDFFRVVGGNEHVYSFHALSDELTEAPTGVTLTPQKDASGNYVGTYAGADIPYKTEGIASGYSYLYNVDKATNPGVGEFAVDFKLKDFRGTVPIKQDMHLRMTMLNEDPVEEVVVANGEPAQKLGNPRTLKFMLVRNTGGNSMFTTVMEPYGSERYIAETIQLPRSAITHADGSAIGESEIFRAIKVVFENGRVDYVLYSHDTSSEYIVTDGDVVIPFKGFMGVYTLDELGANVFSYLNDGTKLGELEAQADYTGQVVSFTRDLVFDNFINVRFDGEVDIRDIVGRYIYIDGESYKIEGAQEQEDGTVSIELGNVSLIKHRFDDGSYSYWMDDGDAFRIPLSAKQDTSPVFTMADTEFTAVAGHNFTQVVTSESPADKAITYKALDLPRGASFDGASGKITWKPDNNQLGEHHIAIEANDGDLNSVIHLLVTVHQSSGAVGDETTTPSTPSNPSTPSTPSTPSNPSTPSTPSTPSAPSGGVSGGVSGGGGSGSGSSSGSGTSSGSTAPSTPSTPDTGDSGTTAEPTERFIDLGNHVWAKEAIYRLVDKGVVNGTGENTYSPAKNIKRADFAIMLTRAFGITEGEGENFVDVDPNKYYAEELRLARAAGIVNGIGQDKFNPEGEITRQDMMLMLSRALDAVEYELSDADRAVLADFADAADISEYAADAVSRVVKDGIIAGANGRINPKANATRAEVAVMLDRVLADEK